MSLGKIIIAITIAAIAIFATLEIQGKVLSAAGWTSTFTSTDGIVVPSVVGAVVFIMTLGRLREIRV